MERIMVGVKIGFPEFLIVLAALVLLGDFVFGFALLLKTFWSGPAGS